MHKTELAGRKNLVGLLMRDYRKANHMSIRKMSGYLHQNGLDWDKNAVDTTELGRRIVSDIELLHLMRILKISQNDITALWNVLK